MVASTKFDRDLMREMLVDCPAATTGCATSDVSIDSIKEAYRKVQEWMASRPELPDTYLLTTEIWQEFKKRYETEQHRVRPGFDTYLGVVVEHYSTMVEVLDRATELAGLGRKVVVVTTDAPVDVTHDG